MAELKTFLFTDIVGSVDLKRQMPGHSDAERDQAFIEFVLRPHRARIERELTALGGRVVSTAGDGHFLVFGDTIQAARWAVKIQQTHRDEPIRAPRGENVAVRISVHLGIPQTDPHDPNNFVGKPVDYAARLCDYATGGQVLVSRSVVAVLEDAGMDGVTFHRHGQRDLKGIGQVEIYELVYESRGPRKMRPQPRESLSRQWTVLPATIGLTEYRGGDVWQPGDSTQRTSTGNAGRQNGPNGSGGVHGTSSDVVPVRLGNYEMEERLGSGGMGDVYRARHVQFGRRRAVKVIRQHFVESGQREVIRRFYQEIKAVGALEHPNIVVAIDSSAPTDSVHYLVMEYIDGIGADVLVAQHGPLPVAEACEVARQAARGLAYIHQHGMVHRDIKPSNLMLTVVSPSEYGGVTPAPTDGEQAVVKILDLGLALLVGEDQQRLTMMDNRAMGTAMYMSPEQWRTTSVDIRADIYSLGCTLYHLLAGKPPYWESDLRPEKAHEREKLPLIERISEALPRELWDVLQKMTAKDAAGRYADPSEAAAALAPFTEGNHLARLVRQVTQSRSGFTHGVSGSETQVAKSVESDTRLGRKSSGRGLSKSWPPLSRRVVGQAAKVAAMLLAVGAIGYLSWLATGNSKSREQVRQARVESLRIAANLASSRIVDQVNKRFAILTRLAADEEVQQKMIQINATPDDPTLKEWFQNLIGRYKSDADPQTPSESWFINDARGIQIARSPSSNKSRGENYSYRDYFHGQGADLAEDTPGLEPIRQPHLSAVYPSTTTGELKVAFSVPIENGRAGTERRVEGVLAMSVDVSEFKVLVEELPQAHEVVLIDRRESPLVKPPRGLILHYQGGNPQRREQTPTWVGPELMARIREILTDRADSEAQTAAAIGEYSDPNITGDRPYWGALRPVVERRSDGEAFDTQWLVLVQEPVAR